MNGRVRSSGKFFSNILIMLYEFNLENGRVMKKKWAATLYAWTIELASFQLWQERVRLLPLPSRLNFHLNSTLFYQESSLFFSHAIWSIAHTRYPISHECLRFIDASMCNFISFDQVSTTSAFISPHFLSLSLCLRVSVSFSLCRCNSTDAHAPHSSDCCCCTHATLSARWQHTSRVYRMLH